MSVIRAYGPQLKACQTKAFRAENDLVFVFTYLDEQNAKEAFRSIVDTWEKGERVWLYANPPKDVE